MREACTQARDTAINRAQRPAIAAPTKEVSDLDAPRHAAWLLNSASAPAAPPKKDEPNG